MSFMRAFFGFASNDVSRAELDTYRGAMRYLDDLDGAIQVRVLSQPLPDGVGPWARRRHQHYAMAFATIARELATVATVLLDSDAHLDPTSVATLPVVTYQQVKALYEQVPRYVQRAWEALANPHYVSDVALPIALGPRMEARGRCPDIHLKGIHAASRSLDAIGEHRLQAFLSTVSASGVVPSDEVKRALGNLTQLWSRAQSRSAFSGHQLAMVTQGGTVPLATHEEAETRLWDSLADYFVLGQLIAMPEMVLLAGANAAGREVSPDDRWIITDPIAVSQLQGDSWGELEMKIFWTEKRWKTTPREERYFAECQRLLSTGDLAVTSRWATCPFDSIYTAIRPVSILGKPISAGYEFHLMMDDDADVLQLGSPRFHRASGYQEEHEGGH